MRAIFSGRGSGGGRCGWHAHSSSPSGMYQPTVCRMAGKGLALRAVRHRRHGGKLLGPTCSASRGLPPPRWEAKPVGLVVTLSLLKTKAVPWSALMARFDLGFLLDAITPGCVLSSCQIALPPARGDARRQRGADGRKRPVSMVDLTLLPRRRSVGARPARGRGGCWVAGAAAEDAQPLWRHQALNRATTCARREVGSRGRAGVRMPGESRA